LHSEEKKTINRVADDRLFTIHELSSTLSVQDIPDSPNGIAITYASVSIIPPNPPLGAVYAAAEILIPSPCPQFPQPYIYVSNRNTGMSTAEGDSIAIFEHVNQGQQNESLVLINQVFTGLNQIRGMEIGNVENGGEEYLMAGAASGTGGVAVFRRTEEGQNLELVVRNQDIPTRTSFVWL
jgi:6-phosphogluconolactonase (cycloisomerase 2 family)